MDNTPVIILASTKVSPDNEERYRKWIDEVYVPLQVQRSTLIGDDIYRIVSLKAGYPERFSLQYYQDLAACEEWLKSPLTADIFKDSTTTFQREFTWMGLFQMNRTFLSGSPVPEDKLTLFIENAPIISFLGFKISNETADDFEKWLNEWAFKAYIPILMKLPGIKAANFYTFTGRSLQKEAKDPDYPQALAIFYFTDLKAYENFESSPERAVFRKALKSDFPSGVSVRWNVQYQLVKSFRK